MAAASESFIAGEGFSTRVLRGGKGDKILFLHGAAGANWSAFHDELSTRFEVIVTEHPGFGESADIPHVCSVADLAVHYRQVLPLLDLKKFHLVGNSFGGWLASELIILERSKIQSLTLMAPTGMFPKPASKTPIPPTREDFTRMLYFSEQMISEILARKLSEKDIAIAERNRLATARYNGKQGYNPQLAELLGSLNIASFIVWGENDRVVPAQHAAYWVEKLRAKAFLLQHCGHLPHIELPALTANWILSQVQEVSSQQLSAQALAWQI